MNSREQRVSYNASNTYSVLNEITEQTETIWMLFHGMGYLSRYFIRQFEPLNKDKNHFIALQAPSKYYQGKDFRIVGASWLTKEDTEAEIENVLRYSQSVYNDAILPALSIAPKARVHILGFSQGVSIASRFVAHNKPKCDHLILHSGGIPKELTPKHFKSFNARTSLIYGTQDEYLTQQKIDYERGRALTLFGEDYEEHTYEGGHELSLDTLSAL